MYSLFQRLYDQTVLVKTSGGDSVIGRIRMVEEDTALVGPTWVAYAHVASVEPS